MRRAAKAVASHVDGTIYQLGRQAVVCQQKMMHVALGPAQHVSWIRVSVHETEAAQAVDSLQELFTGQFAPGAPARIDPDRGAIRSGQPRRQVGLPLSQNSYGTASSCC